jgi:hypothetical protein
VQQLLELVELPVFPDVPNLVAAFFDDVPEADNLVPKFRPLSLGNCPAAGDLLDFCPGLTDTRDLGLDLPAQCAALPVVAHESVLRVEVDSDDTLVSKVILLYLAGVRQCMAVFLTGAFDECRAE